MYYDFENDPRFSGMDPQKLALMKKLLQEGSTKSKDEMISFLIKANTTAQEQGIQFSDEETEILLNIFKQDMSPVDLKRLELLKKVAKKLSGSR